MKRIFRLAFAFVAVAAVAFGGGWVQQRARAVQADEARTRCASSLAASARTSSREQGLIDLYRARVEVLRANFGNAGEALTKARGGIGPEDSAAGLLEKAAAAVKGQDPASGDRIQDAIAAVEAERH